MLANVTFIVTEGDTFKLSSSLPSHRAFVRHLESFTAYGVQALQSPSHSHIGMELDLERFGLGGAAAFEEPASSSCEGARPERGRGEGVVIN